MLSEQLVFTSTSGTLTISPELRNHSFNFAVVVQSGNLKLEVAVTTGVGSVAFNMIGSEESVNLIQEDLDCLDYLIEILIVDEDGTIVQTLSHTHVKSNLGSCVDNWSANSNIEDGKTYVAQMKYMNGEGTKTLVSDTFSFTYTSSTSLTFTYSAIKVA